MFDSIAPSYDSLNHILSMQIDKLWRRRVVKLITRHIATLTHPPRLLDLATGTGDLAIALARNNPSALVTGGDPSEGMLNVAREKVAREGMEERIDLRVESAEGLTFADKMFDTVSVSFGVRNFSDLEGGLREMARVTRRGGVVVVLEFSTPPNPLFRAIYNLYSRHILPRIGALISKNRAAYDYLPASIEEFASPCEFTALMERVGLKNCMARSQSFGIAQIYIGEKI